MDGRRCRGRPSRPPAPCRRPSLAALNTGAARPAAAAQSSICSRMGCSVVIGPGAGVQARSRISGPRCLKIAELGDRVVQGALHEIEVEAAAAGQHQRLGRRHRVHGEQQVRDVLQPRAGAERPGVHPGAGDRVEDRADLRRTLAWSPETNVVASRGATMAGAAADRAVQHVAAARPGPRRAGASCARHRWCSSRCARCRAAAWSACRCGAADDLRDGGGVRDDGQQHVGLGGDLGRRARRRCRRPRPARRSRCAGSR